MVQPVALWVVIPEDLLPLDPLELVEVVGAEARSFRQPVAADGGHQRGEHCGVGPLVGVDPAGQQSETKV